MRAHDGLTKPQFLRVGVREISREVAAVPGANRSCKVSPVPLISRCAAAASGARRSTSSARIADSTSRHVRSTAIHRRRSRAAADGAISEARCASAAPVRRRAELAGKADRSASPENRDIAGAFRNRRGPVRRRYWPTKPRGPGGGIHPAAAVRHDRAQLFGGACCSETPANGYRSRPETPKEFSPKRTMGASVELRCDCNRKRTQAASRIDVFPCPFRPTKKLKPGANSTPSDFEAAKIPELKFSEHGYYLSLIGRDGALRRPQHGVAPADVALADAPAGRPYLHKLISSSLLVICAGTGVLER